MMTTIGAAAKLGASIAGFFGYTRHTKQLQYTVTVPGRGAPDASVEGETLSHVLDLAPSNKPVSREAYLNEKFFDEESFDYLLRRWSHYITWTDPTGALGVHVNVPIGPATVDGIAPAYWFDTLGAVSLPFLKWRGSIEYKLEVFCSQFTRGRVRLAWYKATLTETPDNVTPVVYMEIAPGASADITIPYVLDDPWCDNYLQFVGAPVLAQMGYLRVEIVSPIIQPAGCSDVQFILSRRGGPDFRLAVPGSALVSVSKTAPYVAQTYSAWAVSAKYTAPAAGVVAPGFYPQANDGELIATTVGFIPRSLRDVSQRFSLGKCLFNAEVNGTGLMLKLGRNAYPTDDNNTTLNQYVNSLFLFNSGSIRYMIETTDAISTQVYPSYFKVAYDGAASTTWSYQAYTVASDRLSQLARRYMGTGCSFFDSNSPAIAELPSKDFLVTRAVAPTESMEIHKFYPLPSDAGVVSNIYLANGMDNRNFVYIGPPVLYFWYPG